MHYGTVIISHYAFVKQFTHFLTVISPTLYTNLKSIVISRTLPDLQFGNRNRAHDLILRRSTASFIRNLISLSVAGLQHIGYR